MKEIIDLPCGKKIADAIAFFYIDLPCGEKIADAIAFFYRLREWLGEGKDVLIWWKDQEGNCHYFQSDLGETVDNSATPKIISCRNIDSKVFDKFLLYLKANEILELQMDEDPKILNNYNDYYCVLMESGEFNSFVLIHGCHRNHKFKNIQERIYKIKKMMSKK
jgi:hypothetical protein